MTWLVLPDPVSDGGERHFRLYRRHLAWSEDLELQYRLEVRTFPRGMPRVQVSHLDSSKEWQLSTDWPTSLVPSLLRLIQEASADWGEPDGVFSRPEAVVGHTPEGLGQLVYLALQNGAALGHYPIVGRWLAPWEEGWDEGVYLNLVDQGPERLTEDELRVRLVCGRTYRQDEITEAIVRALRAGV